MLIPEELVNTVTAAVLSAAAKESGLTHTELAAAAGMSRITVQKLLSGRQSIKAHQFLALANATDLTPADIMGRVEAAVSRRMARERRVSEDAFTVKPVDNVTYLGRVTPPLHAAANESTDTDGPNDGA